MKTIEVEKNKYEILKDYKNGFDLDDFISHYTDFYEDYDYIVGDKKVFMSQIIKK